MGFSHCRKGDFWDGADEQDQIAVWKSITGFSDEWGRVDPVRGLNGSSGVWVEEKVLRPLLGRVSARERSWITDCLDTYRCSDGAWPHVTGICTEFARQIGRGPCGNPPCLQRRYAKDRELARDAQQNHRSRLAHELNTAQPRRIVTLGNAALWVMRTLVDEETDAVPKRLSPDSARYGSPVRVRVQSRAVEWFPLVHPRSGKGPCREVHEAWGRSPDGEAGNLNTASPS